MKTIDERVVEMQFNNAQFERNIQTSLNSLAELKKGLTFDSSQKSIADLGKSIKNVSFDSLAKSVDNIASRFTNLGIIGMTSLQRLTNYAITSANRMWQAFAVAPVKTGLSEYETQINAVQTILANTESKGTTLQDVNRALDELNKYADMTIYNFTEMTRNIGTFTAAGVDLEKSVSSIKGIANLAAVSGSSPYQAATAMYQLSQALAAGKVTLMDWNSVVNAGMGGELFQNALKRTARQMGKDVDQLIADAGSFRDSLTEGKWLTADVLTETLTQLSGAYSEADLIAKGYTKEQAAEIYKLSQTAVNAATKVKTWTNLIDTLKEAIQSGWTTTWELIIGDFEEARDLWTGVSNTLGELIGKSADARNAVLAEGLSSGWKQFLNLGITDEMGFKEYVIDSAREYGVAIDDIISKSGTFEKSLKEGWMTADILKTSIGKLTNRIVNLSAEEQMNAGYTSEQVAQLVKLNEEIQNGTVNIDEFVSKMSAGSGRENIFAGIGNIFNTFLALAKPVKEAFTEIFPPITGKQLYEFTENFKSFTEKLTISEEVASKIKDTFKGVFGVFSIGVKFFEIFVSVLMEVASYLSPLPGIILSVSSSLGRYVDGINNSIDKTKILSVISSKLKSILSPLKSGFSDASQSISEFINSINIGETATSWISGISTAFASIPGIISKASSAVSDFIKYFTGYSPAEWVRNISDSILSFTPSDLSNIAIGGGMGILGGGLAKLSKSAKSSLNPITNIKEKLISTLDSVQNTLKSFQTEVNANSILKIAAAIGIFAISLMVLSRVELDRQLYGLLTIGGIFMSLSKAMKSLTGMNLSDGGVLIATGIGLIALSASLAILAGAISKFSDMDTDQIIVSFLSIKILFSSISSLSKDLSKNPIDGNSLIKTAISVVIFGSAIGILAKAVETMGSMDIPTLAKGLGAIAVLLAGIVGFFKVADLNASTAKEAKGTILALAASMIMLSAAIKILGSMDILELSIGMGAVTTMLAAMAVSMKVMDSAGSGKAALSILALAVAINALMLPIFALGSMPLLTLAQGLAGVAAALIIVSGAVSYLGNINTAGLLKGTAAIILIVGAINLLVPALTTLGLLPFKVVVSGVAALALVFGTLGLTALILAPIIPLILQLAISVAALGVTVMAVGIGVQSFGAGLLAIVGAIAALGTLGVAGIGAFIAAIGALLTGVITIIPMIVNAFTTLVMSVLQSLITIIPAAAGVIVTLIAALLTELYNHRYEIVEAGFGILIALMEGLRDNIYHLTEVGTDIITEFIAGLGYHASELVDAGMKLILDIIVAMRLGVDEYMDQIIAEGMRLAGALIEGLIKGIGEGLWSIGESAWNLGSTMISKIKECLGIASPSKEFAAIGGYAAAGLSEGLTSGESQVSSAVVVMADNSIAAIQEKLPQFKELGRTTIIEFLKGINLGEPNVKMAFKDMMSDGVTTIKNKIPEFETSGKEIAQGLARGITNNKSLAINAAIDLANSSKQAANDELGIASPSKEFKKTGSYVAQGFALGMISSINEIVGASSMIRDAAINSFQRALYDAADILNYAAVTHPVTITPVVNLSKVREGAANISKILSSKTSMKMAQNAIAADGDVIAGSAGVSRAVKSGVTFIQNNYSPKALSSIDIYRNTKTQLAGMKARVK